MSEATSESASLAATGRPMTGEQFRYLSRLERYFRSERRAGRFGDEVPGVRNVGPKWLYRSRPGGKPYRKPAI